MQRKDKQTRMAFVANINQLRYNSDPRHKEGGGPHTLYCRDCGKLLEHGDLINGPTRNRMNEPLWSEARPNGFKAQYWHENCRAPKGNGQYANTIPNPVPQPQPSANANGDMIAEIVAAINKTLIPQLENATTELDNEITSLKTNVETRITNLANAIAQDAAFKATVLERLAKLEANQPTVLQITTNNTTHEVIVGTHHAELPKVIKLITSLHPERRNVWLAGPAGSGKTTAARQLASVLIRTTPPIKPVTNVDATTTPHYTVGKPLPFYFNGAIDTEYKLSGFIDANGNVINTAFREAWTNGGVYLFDECDASLSGALTAFNGALANGHAPFPGELIPVPRHPDCYILAAANTWGFGGDAHYVGRAKLDGAFLSRFIRREWGYDEKLERVIAGNDEWVNVVRDVRNKVYAKGVAFLVTPRDSLNGADLLRAGLTRREVADEIFGYIKRQDTRTYNELFTAVEAFANKPELSKVA